ncbi:MAG: insulinase family protein [Saprospirales bacterium]|nr:insulinase family protein [Saprospirales bacterium]MBK7336883.1 insulinase family protein [Saprospirales bacterium]
MPNRSKAPKIHEIRDVVLPRPLVHRLDNGIPVYEIHMGVQDVLKVEVIFQAGRPFEAVPMVSRATASLIREGTAHRSGAEIAEVVDFFGGTLSSQGSLDHITVTLYCLTRHFDALAPLLTDVLTEPSFPEDELKAFINRNKQRLQVDLTRNDIVAYRLITECIYGPTHPYGYNSTPELYEALTRDDLQKHFRDHLIGANCQIFVSGKTNDAVISRLNAELGKALPQGVPSIPRLDGMGAASGKLHQPHSDTVQTAIRLGRRLFARDHADSNGLFVLNTILGGYFGSRLMTNIREEKGYTYNIYSSLDPMQYDGYFYVGTEVSNEFAKRALDEIYREMEILQKKPVGKAELGMVRNYLMGNFLTMLDGPFNLAEVIRNYLSEGLPLESFEEMVRTVRQIDAAQLMELANKYFNPSEMWEVIVGNPV